MQCMVGGYIGDSNFFQEIILKEKLRHWEIILLRIYVLK